LSYAPGLRGRMVPRPQVTPRPGQGHPRICRLHRERGKSH